jgi:hypothetical protein
LPSHMAESLTLYHKLLKNHGALSEYAKCGQSSTKIQNLLKSLIYILGTMVMSKKPSHTTVRVRKVAHIRAQVQRKSPVALVVRTPGVPCLCREGRTRSRCPCSRPRQACSRTRPRRFPSLKTRLLKKT